MTAQQNKQPKKTDETVEQKITCGIIMPIATMSPEYTAEHWEDVRAIIDAAIELAGFEPRIVSDSEDSTIIHKSIINNIYHDEIIVCDVSNKNANVMFELGMRLAFNKPVVIIKDDKTGYSFDTSNIEHIGYRKDLRHNTVEKFIVDLARKIKATYEAPKKDGYQPFLSHFGKFEVAKIENKSIEGSEALANILNKVTAIATQLDQTKLPITINEQQFAYSNKKNKAFNSSLYIKVDNFDTNKELVITQSIASNIPDVLDVKFDPMDSSVEVLLAKPVSITYATQLEDKIQQIIDYYHNLE